MEVGGRVKRVLLAVGGGLVLAIGVLLLVLPGPGLLLVLAGLLMLSAVFPKLNRYVEPVRKKAMKGMEDSVSSPLRIAASASLGVLLIAAGLVWALVKSLPLSGWSSGSSLILSGLIVFGLLIWSYRRVRSQRAARTR